MIGFDTNVLVHAYSQAHHQKHKIASALVEEVFSGEKQGAVSNQVLAELAYVLSHKTENTISGEDIANILNSFLICDNWYIYEYTTETIVKALRPKRFFWDALIAETFKEHQIPEVYTEDTDGFRDSGLKVRNPFV